LNNIQVIKIVLLLFDQSLLSRSCDTGTSLLIAIRHAHNIVHLQFSNYNRALINELSHALTKILDCDQSNVFLARITFPVFL